MEIVNYNSDVIGWSEQQAAFLRNGDFKNLDLSHLAEEIEDVGKSEQRELASRMAVLIAHLLKWQFQSSRQCSSWEKTIKVQRRDIARRLKKTPSLKYDLNNEEWLEDIMGDASIMFIKETNLDYPDSVAWTIEEILNNEFYPF